MTTTYTYGADGLRRSSTTNGVTTYYVSDGQSIVQEMQQEKWAVEELFSTHSDLPINKFGREARGVCAAVRSGCPRLDKSDGLRSFQTQEILTAEFVIERVETLTPTLCRPMVTVRI